MTQVAGVEWIDKTRRVTASVHHMSAQPTVQVAAGITLRSGDEDMGGSGNPSPEGVT